ncbi:MAG: hypothetical protein ABIS30_00585 [Gallionella sp.]
MRAKAATGKAESSGDIRQAQKQLGHTTIGMTEHYTRNRRGEKVGRQNRICGTVPQICNQLASAIVIN